MTPERIAEWAAAGESETPEFKETTGHKSCERQDWPDSSDGAADRAGGAANQGTRKDWARATWK